MKSILLVLVMGWGFLACQNQNSSSSGIIHTVHGPIKAQKLTFALTHEHLMSNFGKDPEVASEYDEQALLEQVIPYLKHLKSLGVDYVFDCTTEYFGRRVDLLKMMADSSGISVITNTGFYGAANDRYVPEFAYNATPEEISKIWIEEYENGIEGSGIKPGFIKLAFDIGPPSDIDKKLFTAGILTHLATGLTMAVHTSNNPEAAEAQLQLLEQYQVHPSAWIWVHAHNVDSVDVLLEKASSGAWISLDGAKESNIKEFIYRIDRFKEKGLLDKLLLSHDGDGYPMGGEIRKFEAIPKYLIPAMKEKGYTDQEIDQLMVGNPRAAFAVKVRRG